eukprot:14692904-Ditylum_brightwellii.AAC.1
MAVYNKPHNKTISRAQTEASLQSTMSYILTVAHTQLIIGKPPMGYPSIKKKGSKGAQPFHQM